MINNNYFILNVFLLTIGTIFIRGIFIAFSSKIQISANVKELFTYIPAAIFPALFIPVTFFHKGSVDFLGGKERFIVLIVAGMVCYFVRNTLLFISFGLLLLYVVQKI